MSAPPSEQSFAGLVASPGLALGPIRLQLTAAAASAIPQGTPAEERKALEAAIAAAQARLAELAEVSDPMAAEILTVQIAFLEDPELAAPALAAIAGGGSAMAAWRAAMNEQIAGYQESDNAYFRARASDMIDLRDRVADGLASKTAAPPPPTDAILVANDLPPSRFLETDWSCYRGAVLTQGSAASHVSMLARARGIPMLVGLDADLSVLTDGAAAVLDAQGGRLIQHPAVATLDRYRQHLARLRADATADAAFLNRPAVTADGTRVQVCLNVDDPAALGSIDPAVCDGIGLTRSEFLFFADTGLPDEETQFQTYLRLLAWADGKPVTVRTLDAGGDKPIAGLTPDREANPFLGQRGLRLSLARPEVFRVQLRALARAAARGPLKVMVPMVTVPAELDRTRALFQEVVTDLLVEGFEARMPSLGMMVEVPAAALAIATFDADFYSIGSNDLVQYVTAASRDNAAVADLYDPLNPAVIELIGRIVSHGAATSREVSLCGDIAAEPKFLAPLLDAGLRVLSVAPASLAQTKAAVSRCTLAGGG